MHGPFTAADDAAIRRLDAPGLAVAEHSRQPLEGAIEYARDRHSRLAHVLEELERRLVPVLSDSDVPGEDTAGSVPATDPRSIVTRAVHELGRDADRLADRIGMLIKRLDT